MPLQFEPPQGDPREWLLVVEEEIARMFANEIKSIAREAANLYFDSLTASGDYAVFDVIRIRWENFVNNQVVNTFAGLYSDGSISVFMQAPGAAALSIEAASQWVAVVNTDAVEYARTMSNRLVDVGDDVWSGLSQQISDGIQSGDLRDRLREVIQKTDGFSEVRAERVARTEVTRAFNAGSLAGAQALGEFGPVEKVWATGLDGRVRDTHLEAEGQYVPINDSFDVGGFAMSAPGDGPAEECVNCRCTMLMLYPGDTRPDGTVVPEGGSSGVARSGKVQSIVDELTFEE
jgi:hypothetical protein